MLIQLKKLSDLNIWTSIAEHVLSPSQSRHVNLRIPVVFSGVCILANLQRAQSADRQIDRSTDPVPSGSIAAIADPSSTWAPVWWYPYHPWIFGQMWELWDSMMMMIFEDIWHVASIVDSKSFPEVLLIGGLPCFALSIAAAPLAAGLIGHLESHTLSLDFKIKHQITHLDPVGFSWVDISRGPI